MRWSVGIPTAVLLALFSAGCWRHPAPPRDEVMLGLFFQKRAAFEAVIAEAMRPDGIFQSKKKPLLSVFPGESSLLDGMMADIGLYSITYSDSGNVYLNYDAWGMLDYGWYKYFLWTKNRRSDSEISFDLDALARDAIRENYDELACRPIEGYWYICFSFVPY